ncbi:DUF805 domain-containing protein [Sulfitobacter sp. SK012]|uniref:DUF805 domain-containing protein n=1 Tax=Sulfitobacter sp. SK012 TaxID=1389005 RepID=UPI0013B46118|nr:DUF805 domain-containing protein [Sulfitobacter sp. SK012]
MVRPLTALNTAFVKVFTFSGRATRAEFWWFFLICTIVGVIAMVFDGFKIAGLYNTHGDMWFLNVSPFEFSTFYVTLITGIPYLSLQIRRLHDAGFSGFWFLIAFVPLGGIVLMIFYCLPSKNDHNAYGPPPFGGTDVTGKPITQDAHKRAMQGYACLFETDQVANPETVAARKAEVSDYYRTHVLKTG